jgi:sugar phosphate isomerase/epimerase
MVDWATVERDLAAAGYTDFEVDTGETAVPGMSGAWLAGTIDREGRLKRTNLPLLWRLLDTLPCSSTVPADPEYAPAAIRQIAQDYGLDVVIVSVGSDWVRIALVEPN